VASRISAWEDNKGTGGAWRESEEEGSTSLAPDQHGKWTQLGTWADVMEACENFRCKDMLAVCSVDNVTSRRRNLKYHHCVVRNITEAASAA